MPPSCAPVIVGASSRRSVRRRTGGGGGRRSTSRADTFVVVRNGTPLRLVLSVELKTANILQDSHIRRLEQWFAAGKTFSATYNEVDRTITVCDQDGVKIAAKSIFILILEAAAYAAQADLEWGLLYNGSRSGPCAAAWDASRFFRRRA